MPALVNAHDHGRAVRTSSIGASGKPLEAWLQYLALFPSVDPYLAAAVSLGNSALGGAGIVMMHYTRAQGFTDLPTEVTEVARAARDVGVRVGFAVSMKDRNPIGYGPPEPLLDALPKDAREEIVSRFVRPPLAPKDYIKLVEDVAAAADGPTSTCNMDRTACNGAAMRCWRRLPKPRACPGGASTCICSKHAISAAISISSTAAMSSNSSIRSACSPPRLTLAHCVWARPDELELLAARGVTISTNSSSNLKLRSGVAPVAKMLGCGCRVAMGIDGGALDDDDDMLRELRLTHLLHLGSGFTPKVSESDMLSAAAKAGRLSVTNSAEGGIIEPGAPADLLLLDYDALDDDAPSRRSRSGGYRLLEGHGASHARTHRRRTHHRARRPRARHRSGSRPQARSMLRMRAGQPAHGAVCGSAVAS